MNPFNNRWLALVVIVGLLFVVAELIGSGENGGVLAQAASSQSPDAGEEPPAADVQAVPDAPVAEEPAEEDMPEVMGSESDDVVDAADGPADGADAGEPDQIDADATGDESFDDSGDE